MAYLTTGVVGAETSRAKAHSGVAAKRAADVAGAGLALLLLSPLLAAILLALAADGAPIFTQTRIGRRGRRFACYKFRTMRIGAERDLPALISAGEAARWRARQKLDADPRVTRFGRILRRWGLDELPQLINVLKGDMSLVGPRPVIPPETPGYPADAAYARSGDFAPYLSMRPGITGLWQVCGGADTPHRKRVRLDRVYVRSWSLALDVKIVLATPRALLQRKAS